MKPTEDEIQEALKAYDEGNRAEWVLAMLAFAYRAQAAKIKELEHKLAAAEKVVEAAHEDIAFSEPHDGTGRGDAKRRALLDALDALDDQRRKK